MTLYKYRATIWGKDYSDQLSYVRVDIFLSTSPVREEDLLKNLGVHLHDFKKVFTYEIQMEVSNVDILIPADYALIRELGFKEVTDLGDE